MNRLVLNGSPRGIHSNSRTIISWLLIGLREAGAEAPSILDLARVHQLEEQRRAFLEADEVLLIFPLYADSVPGIVKNFIDSLAAADSACIRGKRFCFVVHSGFPGSAHSDPVAAYLKRLCGRFGMQLVGAAQKGLSEGFRFMPGIVIKKTELQFVALGRNLAQDGSFDPETIKSLVRPPLFSHLYLRALTCFIVNLYLIVKLRQHRVWKRRFDRPYAQIRK
jgi:multimeric flavodoxin WrbA